MPTEIELTLEQTQQGVSYEVLVFTMKMEILLEPASNKLMVAGNPVKKILLKLNLSDHRSILTDMKVTPTKPGRMTKPYSSPLLIATVNAGYLTELWGDFRYSDTTHLSQSVEVLKLKNFKKDATLKLSKSNIKKGMSMSVQKSQVHKTAKSQDGKEIMLG
ncbi:hypothetical protein Tco_1312349 [Tanacetum coccineum]